MRGDEFFYDTVTEAAKEQMVSKGEISRWAKKTRSYENRFRLVEYVYYVSTKFLFLGYLLAGTGDLDKSVVQFYQNLPPGMGVLFVQYSILQFAVAYAII